MGNLIPKRRKRSVLVVGLDGCGKTTLITNLKGVQERCLFEAQQTSCQTLPTSVLQLIEYQTRDFDRFDILIQSHYYTLLIIRKYVVV